MVIVSIDPGLKGGIATQTEVYSMPIKKVLIKKEITVLDLDSKGKKQYYKTGTKKGEVKYKIKTPAKYKIEIDIKAIAKILKTASVLVIEAATMSIGNSAKSTHTTSVNWGKIVGIAEYFDIPIVVVPPTKWKADLQLSKEKEDTVIFVEQQYKNIPFRTTNGTLLDGKADAMAINIWYRKQIYD